MRKSPTNVPFAPGTSLLDEIGVGLVIIGDGGEILVTNRVADAMLTGRTGGVPLMHKLFDLLDASERTESGKGSKESTVELIDEGSKKTIIGVRIVSSRRLGTMITLTDVTETERSQAERRQLERLSEVGKACAMVAHEIGNPLAAIKATIQSIEHEAAAAGLGDSLHAVNREIDRLNNMLGQLLGFVRHRPPRRTKSDLQTIVSRARHMAEGRLERIRFSVRYGSLRPVWVDQDQLQQVLLNLFINAADAMPEGGDLWMYAGIDDDRVVLRVEDSGVGIPPEFIDKVFDSFFMTKPTGTGLGLSICYRIVNDHGGSITIGARDGNVPGTCVTITLPIITGR
ncbi:MAG TPA: ATP-binding protein [Polyangium sp.]|nr:ATP-binding protein [Polyangium sp.]